MSGYTLYAHAVSQPSRAVLWALSTHKVPFMLVEKDPIRGQTRTPEFLKINPAGTIPTLAENGNDFVLFESAAILNYLAETHQWKDLFPDCPKTRAKIQEYFNWQQKGTRRVTEEVFRPALIAALTKKSPEEVAKVVSEGLQEVKPVLTIIEGMLSKSAYLVADKPTAADLLGYCEIGQIQELGYYDFKDYPKISDWLSRMKKYPGYEENAQGVLKLAGALKARMAKAKL